METRLETVEGAAGAFEVLTLFDVQPFHNNVYVVRDPASRQCLVIDASEAAPILEATAGWSVQTILITHGHRDHVAGLVDLAAAVPAPVAVGEADTGLLPMQPHLVLQHGQTLAFGPHAVQAHATPGHTPGSTCFVLDGWLFSGDTLFPGGPGNTRGERNKPGDFATIMGSLRTHLFTLADETRVLPGHGEPTTIGRERPRLDEWEARGW